jgi:hypothetical protein
VEVSENIVVNEVNWNRSNSTVLLTVTSREFTEEVALTDPSSADSEGSGTVNQKGVTIPAGETKKVPFQIEYGKYSGSATVWISTGVGETKYVSNPVQELIDRLEWLMIPATSLATALAAALCAIVVIYRKQRKLKNKYTNGPRNI